MHRLQLIHRNSLVLLFGANLLMNLLQMSLLQLQSISNVAKPLLQNQSTQ